MARVIVGVFHTYSSSQAAVRDLEIAGITGEQVEVISGADEDVRGVDAGLDAPHSESIAERIAHFFRGLTGSEAHRVHDYYVEDQEFYAGEVRQGRTMLIVRPPSDREADIASEVMRSHGGAGVTGEKMPSAVRENDNPETVTPRATGSTETTIGAPHTTTGNYQMISEAEAKSCVAQDAILAYTFIPRCAVANQSTISICDFSAADRIEPRRGLPQALRERIDGNGSSLPGLLSRIRIWIANGRRRSIPRQELFRCGVRFATRIWRASIRATRGRSSKRRFDTVGS